MCGWMARVDVVLMADVVLGERVGREGGGCGWLTGRGEVVEARGAGP